ncbi:MAG: FadR family transcriptional regulator, partial [Chloroflexi bacterium]|nr:FadR family transcriptional regulator [Chloroflexota bacterium]
QGVGTFVAQDLHAGLTQSLLWALRYAQVTDREIIDLAQLVETQCALLAAHRRTDEDLVDLQDVLQPATTRDDLAAPQTASDAARFHAALVACAHNRALTAVYGPLLALIGGTAESEPIGPGSSVAEQHRRIAECIRQGDVEATRVAMRQHSHAS